MDAKKQTPAAPPPQPAAAPAPALTFEQALARLEAIVDSMESGDTPLAELLVKFEDGTRLLKLCEARLKDAELKIELLRKQKNGAPTLADFPAAASRE